VGDPVRIFASHVEVGSRDRHRIGRDQDAFEYEVRIVLHELPVLEGARLALVTIAAEVTGLARLHWWHKAPLHAGQEAGTASTTEAAVLDGGSDLDRIPVVRLEHRTQRGIAAILLVDIELMKILYGRKENALV